MPESSPDVKTIRAAIQKNRGGWDGFDDEAVLRLWKSLDAETQLQYLDSLQEKETKADDSVGS